MLPKSLIFLLSLGVTGCTMATSASTTQVTPVMTSSQKMNLNSKNMMNLSSYQWKNRLLLVFAPSKNMTAYQQQMQLFKGQQASFDERKLLLFEVLTNANDTEIRQQFNVNPEEFLVVLVGKDGTAKRRDNTPISPQAIFTTIDAMPMRQQEMRQNLN